MVDKVAEVNKIRLNFEEWRQLYFPSTNPARMCFYQACFAHQHLRTLGLGKVLISAGSFSIPRIDLKQDDGKIDTHFSYIFENTRENAEKVKNNIMPEMHCWAFLADRMEIVDITTRYVKEQCETTTGMNWLAADPPDFIWASPNNLPKGVNYTFNPLANKLVAHFYTKTWLS